MKNLIPIILLFANLLPISAQKLTYHLLVGTYTNTGKSKGIYTYDVDMTSGIFTQKSVATGVSNPSYLALTTDRKFVYSVNESPDNSAVNAFCFDKGNLQLLNQSLTKSSGSCFVLATQHHVITANYGGGSISVFGRQNDGKLTDVLQVIQHAGSSVNAERQGEPHVHQVIVSPDKKYIIANDLGTDKVTVYRYHPNAKNEILTPYDTLTVKLGSGPRHATFSKDGKRLYLVQEIDGTVSVLNFSNGRLSLLQETTLDRKPGTVNRAADIHLSPDEKYLYATNRGSANNITCFAVGKNGKLTFKQQLSSGGDGPRNFAITPDGNFVFVAHQFTDNIVVFKRNALTGELTNTGKSLEVGAPVCLVFY
jgi:3-carboxymuconate cyclase